MSAMHATNTMIEIDVTGWLDCPTLLARFPSERRDATSRRRVPSWFTLFDGNPVLSMVTPRASRPDYETDYRFHVIPCKAVRKWRICLPTESTRKVTSSVWWLVYIYVHIRCRCVYSGFEHMVTRSCNVTWSIGTLFVAAGLFKGLFIERSLGNFFSYFSVFFFFVIILDRNDRCWYSYVNLLLCHSMVSNSGKDIILLHNRKDKADEVSLLTEYAGS